VPEYLQKEAEEGKAEDIGGASVISESLDIFRTQQRVAHDNGIRTTIQMTYASLFNEEAVAIAKEDHEKYGDEIGSTFLGHPVRPVPRKVPLEGTRDLALLDGGQAPRSSTRSSASSRRSSASCRPRPAPITWTPSWSTTSRSAIRWSRPRWRRAGRKGPKAYHNANNSWYTLLDGGPWNPWIPSKRNIHCPASDEADDIGIVAIPHLSRDLMAVFDGPGSYYGTHPQNILRGMVYEGPRDPVLHEHRRPVPGDGEVQPRLLLQHDVRRARLDEQERPLGSRLRLPAQELRRRHGVLRPAQERGQGRRPHHERVRRRLPGRTARTPARSARSGKTSCTAPNGSSSGSRIRGCASAWT
jgi:hypothetical protein